MGLIQWRRVAFLLQLNVCLLMFFEVAESHRDDQLGRIYHVELVRILGESGNISESELTSRTERVDPLDGLKKYKGGFNITNKHYWSSTIFTGKFGYFIGAAWLLIGIIYAAIMLVSSICCSLIKRHGRKKLLLRRVYYWPLLLSVLLTSLSIIASGVALGGTSRFHYRAMKIKNVVVDTANNASGTIFTMTTAVENLQNVTELGQDVEHSRSLESISKKINDEARNIERKAGRTMRLLSKGLKILNIVTIVTVSLNMIVFIALLFSRPFRLWRTFLLFLILCWILTALLWVYFGLYYFFGEFAGDICIALDEFKQNPENSTLSSILPCNDPGSAKELMHDVGGRIYDIIEQANSNITSLKSSFPGLEYICNPFSGPPDYNYQANCSSDTMTVGQIPQLIENYACSGGGGVACKPGEFIPAQVYSKVELYTSSVQAILDSYPVMKSLVDCQLVKDAFLDILSNHCKPLKKFVHMSWASLATLSTIMVILSLLWTSEAHRMCKYRSPDGSVKPTSSPTEIVEVNAAEVATNYELDKVDP
ncbi:hypothetical protein HPP92_023721 [Vanilla planifolia]|uniref:Transmembrane protein n=1 Tax=Vanilla planifolia TaxID=51239 RepID=A0A835PVW8_VANPL|nr:hypothetical protein HPP92_023721 [Vanilla planifolia]